MSFGYSIGDAALLVNLAWQTFQNARQACGEHDELTREIRSIHRVLQRLNQELGNPASVLNRAGDSRRRELNELGEGCERILTLMNSICSKYNALSESKRSGKKLWQKIRFGNGEMKDLSEIRQKLATHTSALLMSINLASLGSQGRVESELGGIGGELEGIRSKVDWIAANMAARAGDGTVWTNYDGDEKVFWRELRRKLVREGYGSQVLHKHKDLIQNYVKELGDRGAFDDLVEEQAGGEHASSEERLTMDNEDLAVPSPSSPVAVASSYDDSDSQSESHVAEEPEAESQDSGGGRVLAEQTEPGSPVKTAITSTRLGKQRVATRHVAMGEMAANTANNTEETNDDNDNGEHSGTMREGCREELIDDNDDFVDQRAIGTSGLETEANVGESSQGDQTLKLTDVLGRKFTFPFESVRKWEDMKNYIDEAFSDEPDLIYHVKRERYDLQGPNGCGITPPLWQSAVQPGWKVTMTMWPIDSPPQKQQASGSKTQDPPGANQNDLGGRVESQQSESDETVEIFIRMYVCDKTPFLITRRTTSLEVKRMMVARDFPARTEDIYLFNHVDRKPLANDVVLWERGVRQGSLLEVLPYLWRQA